MEAELLLWIHRHEAPSLDALFVVSSELGRGRFCLALVVVVVVISLLRGARREAALFAALGASTWVLQAGLKVVLMRPRPALWPRLVEATSYSLPSGHALASATLYPALGWLAARRWPEHARLAWAAGVAMALYIGVGRLYLGVHWPTDVLAGWALGAGQLALALALVRRDEAERLALDAGERRLDRDDPSADPDAWARALGVSREAVEIYLASDVIDLHVDTFIWTRVAGYDLRKRHGPGFFDARFYGQADLPRLREARLTGAVFVITTNPLRTRRGRADVFVRNLRRLRAVLASVDEVELVRNLGEYRRARGAGKLAAFVGIQGGNALDDGLEALDRIEDDLVVRITLVHLSNSRIGATSAPLRGEADHGLSAFGRDYVRRLNDKKILVDLAHISKKGFADAVEVHDRSQPLIVTHTGVSGVHPHWRNLDDGQLRAVADTAGTVGVMYHVPFLGHPAGDVRVRHVVDHLAHIVRVVGDDHASLGSDWDGAIVTPRDMPTCLELPRLVQEMLARGWSAERIGKILGGNFLRVVGALRG
jgi:membrane dipeptidase